MRGAPVPGDEVGAALSVALPEAGGQGGGGFRGAGRDGAVGADGLAAGEGREGHEGRDALGGGEGVNDAIYESLLR